MCIRDSTNTIKFFLFLSLFLFVNSVCLVYPFVFFSSARLFCVHASSSFIVKTYKSILCTAVFLHSQRLLISTAPFFRHKCHQLCCAQHSWVANNEETNLTPYWHLILEHCDSPFSCAKINTTFTNGQEEKTKIIVWLSHYRGHIVNKIIITTRTHSMWYEKRSNGRFDARCHLQVETAVASLFISHTVRSFSDCK